MSDSKGGPHDDLMGRLGYRFHDRALLQLALTHSSAVGQRDAPRRSNERLEFLGDRVLGLIIAEMLYKRFAEEPEGALARRHAALVRRAALARVAEEIGLAEHVRVSRAEAEAGGHRNPGLLADTCEAVIAAMYLDGGLAVAERFVVHYWWPLAEEAVRPPKDAKTELQEWAQARGMGLPEYREVTREGPAHAPVFWVEVRLADLPPVVATGASKRAAEQAAARALLARIVAGEAG